MYSYHYGIMGFTRNHEKSMLYFYFAALGGDPSANMILGYKYHEGITVNKSCETSASYYRVAARYAADIYIEGNSIPSDKYKFSNNERLHSQSEEQDMIYYLEHRAHMGEKNAQLIIGQYYYYGIKGAEKNYKKAYDFLLMAKKVFIYLFIFLFFSFSLYLF